MPLAWTTPIGGLPNRPSLALRCSITGGSGHRLAYRRSMRQAMASQLIRSSQRCQRVTMRCHFVCAMLGVAAHRPAHSLSWFPPAWFRQGNPSGGVTGPVVPLQALQASHTDNKCLDVSESSTENGSTVIQWQCHGGDNQAWRIERADDGYYSRLVSRQSGKCLDVRGESRDDGAPVIQWQCHGGANQQWRLEAVGTGYRFVARHSGKCLDVAGSSTDDGIAIIQWQCHGGANQTWLVRER